MNHRRPLGCIATLAAIAAAALCGCTSQADLRKAELAELVGQLPGRYENARQTLVILRLTAPLVGDQVFYVRETAAGDVRRVISEHIWSLDVAGDQRIIGAVYAFEEPERWQVGLQSPELFRSLLVRDLRPLGGCALLWQKSPQGFTAASLSASCPQSWRLEGEALSFSERPGASAESYFHFVRRGGGR